MLMSAALFSLLLKRIRPVYLIVLTCCSVLWWQYAVAEQPQNNATEQPISPHYFDQQTILQIGSGFAPLLLIASIIYLLHIREKLSKSIENHHKISNELKMSTDKLAYMVATSPTVLFAMRIKGNSLQTYWISDNLTRLTGYTQEEALQSSWWLDHLYEDDRARITNESMILFLGQHMAYEYRFMHFNGSTLWIRDEQQVVLNEFGKPQEVLSAWTDITERKLKEDNLSIAATAFETKDSIIITDKHNRIIRVNKAFTRLTGYSEDEVLGQSPNMLSSDRQDADFYNQMWQELDQEQRWEGELWNKRKNGEVFPERLVITVVKDALGEVSYYVATFFDITERKQSEDYIKSLAYYDSLTSLPNRRLMLDRLGIALASSKRSQRHGALMFMDLDRFKLLNDTQGHDMGDQLLIEVAKRIQTCVREGDTVARLGGDEFVVMLENLSESQCEAAVYAQKIAEKIRSVLSRIYTLPLEPNDTNKPYFEHHSSASLGLVLFCGNHIASEELLKQADLAMYQAKHAGRDAVRIFDPAMQLALNARTNLEADLRQALNRNELRLFYQVQVDVDGRAVGAEALLRWHHPQLGDVLPIEFLPLAEETGLILSIGQWIVAEVCATLASWAKHPATQSLTLAVNISTRQFRQVDFVAQIKQTLKASAANPKHLKLEITESLFIDNLHDTITKMDAIKQLGVGFSMDDFGTGYSSLSYIQQMPLDQLKIDHTFIHDLGKENNHNTAIIRTILALGKSLNLTVIAEGVETAEQQHYLAQQGCPVFQGYFFGKPLPLMELEAYLQTS